MVYKYLGWGITNENGVAHLDHDAQGQEIEHSYTGVGAGEVDVVASLDNPIGDGSIVSEPCNVWDYIVYDEAITGKKSSTWTDNGLTVTTGDTGTTLTGAIAKYVSTIAITGDFEATVDATTSGGNFEIGLQNSDASKKAFFRGSFANGGSVKIKRENGVVTAKYTINGSTWYDWSGQSSNNLTSEDCYFTFSILNASYSVVYKDLKVYPI